MKHGQLPNRRNRALLHKEGLKDDSISQIQKFFLARKYNRLSRKAYKIVKVNRYPSKLYLS